jgi:hypothetical protein
MDHLGTAVAICNAAMRERQPRSGMGVAFTLMIFVVATVLALKTLLAKIPRP